MENQLPFEKIKREVLIKKQAETNPKYGCEPEKRLIEEYISYGVVNINKPEGPTSHQISDYVKKILQLKKAGHSGTLDPKVTGVLPTALENATRVVQTLLPSGKEYIALMHLHKEIPEDKIKEVSKQFVAKIKQLPPVKSAVKRQLRQREIYYLNILEIDGKSVLFQVGCQAGTYIRKLIHDMAIKMGTKGHMQQLIRTKAGPFKDKNWHSLHDLKDAYEFYKSGDESELRKVVLPFEFAVSHLPHIWILDTTVDPLCHGTDLASPGISKLHSEIKKNDLVAIFTLKNELVGLGTALLNSQEMLEKNKDLAVEITKVFMQPDIYPRYQITTKK